jgi:hypothetical protein
MKPRSEPEPFDQAVLILEGMRGMFGAVAFLLADAGGSTGPAGKFQEWFFDMDRRLETAIDLITQ